MTSSRARSACGNSYVQYGSPSLRCSHPWGVGIREQLHGSVSAMEPLAAASSVSIWVEWGDTNGEGIDLWTLFVRRHGVVIGQRAVQHAGQLLCMTIPLAGGSGDGDELVIELRWCSGSRCLHLLPTLAGSAQLNLADLVSAGSLGALPTCGELLAPSRSWRRTEPERGFGLELEFITLVPPSHAGMSKGEELRHLILSLFQGASAPLHPLLDRVLRWTVDSDLSIYGTSSHLARQAMLSAKHAPSLSLEAIRRAQERSLLMLQGGAGTLQSEFKSPLPPHELSFSHNAPEEIACAVRLIECLGAAAPPVSLSGHSGTALHVHVNVFNRMAAGPTLTALEVVAVWMAWVRFDSVTRRFARPWFWRNKFCAPLHATGAEFLYIDLAWEQGSSTLEGTGQAPGDVPRFIAAVSAVLRSPGFDELPEARRVELLFGYDDASPTRALGRYCSLSLLRLCSFGTLEFRRFHSSLDAHTIIAWAHFCVSFVEVFRHDAPAMLESLTMSPSDAIAALQSAQERATSAELMQLMASHCDASLVELFALGSRGACEV